MALFLLQAINLNAQNHRWDAEQYIYTDFDNGFYWAFPHYECRTWEKQIGLEKHTVFRAYQPETDIVAFVNVNKLEKEPKYSDIWDLYGQYEKLLNYADSIAYSRTGEKIIDRTISKSILAGQHAIKTTYKSTITDDRFKTGKVYYATTYSVYGNNATYRISVKTGEAYYKKYGQEEVNDIFKGFGFNSYFSPLKASADQSQLPAQKKYSSSIFDFAYPAGFSTQPIESASHMVVKLASKEYMLSISYWDYGFGEEVSAWDDAIFEYYKGLKKDGCQMVETVKSTIVTNGGAVKCIKQKTNESGNGQNVKGLTYMILHKGRLFIICCFSYGTYKASTPTPTEDALLKGLYLK